MDRGIGWFEELREDRQLWVDASRKNKFERGIWNATVEKYADPVHFIFELMQNAEDEGAHQATVEIRDDAIVFEHDGNSFEYDDVDGITGIGNTTKLDEANKIGCFGIGFKAVYVICDRPEIHTQIAGEAFAFAIRDLVVPDRIPYDGTPGRTRFVLRLRDDAAKTVIERLKEQLRDSGPRAMLFLNSLRELTWSQAGHREQYNVEDLGDGIRKLSRKDTNGTIETERVILLSRPLHRDDAPGDLTVKLALRLNAAGEVIRTSTATKLAVFFETEEVTGLFFHLHGPFRLTDNRANVKRGDDWNDLLVDQIASLLAESLPTLRDRGFLKRRFLDVMPNASDQLPQPWKRVLDRIVLAFQSEALVPAHFGGHLPATSLARGPTDVRDLLGDAGLQQLSGRTGARWSVSGTLRNNREDVFLSGLGISEWGPADLANTICRGLLSTSTANHVTAWVDGLDDEHTQRLYLILDATSRTAKLVVGLSVVPFVRLESGRRARPGDALLPPQNETVDPEIGAGALALVKSALVRAGKGGGKDVEQFLRRLGAREVAERDYLRALIRIHYSTTATIRPTVERHLKHMRRFVRWWQDHKDVSPFHGGSFLRVEGMEDLFPPSRVYLDDPFAKTDLFRVYDGSIPGRNRHRLWSGYSRLPRENIREFMAALGVENRLVISTMPISSSHPNYADLKYNFNARTTASGHDRDYMIANLGALLARNDLEVSRLVWKVMEDAPTSVLRASYTPNQQYTARKASSSLAIMLASTAWVPARDGSLKRPKVMTGDDLAPGFTLSGNEEWLSTIGFGQDQRRKSEQHLARQRAAEVIGLPPEFADKFAELSPAVRGQVIQDLMRQLADGGSGQPVFPEKASSNPDHRATVLAKRTREAAQKTYEKRERSVRISDNESQTSARIYLADLYTNEADEMVCQVCHNEMPFRLADGRPYFEAVEYLPTLLKEVRENHLALCPTCAAKWRHVNAETPERLAEAIRGAVDLQTTPKLAGASVRLRFVEVHLADLCTVLAEELTDETKNVVPEKAEI